jgi:hypothetical protein
MLAEIMALFKPEIGSLIRLTGKGVGRIGPFT